MITKKRKVAHDNEVPMETVQPGPSEEKTEIQDDCSSLLYWGLPRSVYMAYAQKGIKNLYEWQVECLRLPHVLSGKNLVYSAPTSGGKTLVSELLCLKGILELSKKAIFVVPYKSMVREKARYFQELLQDEGLKVGGFTGKHSPNGGFDAVDLAICVTEKANSLINRLLSEERLDELAIIVVDEVHQIGDNNRGYLLEDILTKIMFMKLKMPGLRIQIVGMSATLPNIETLARWLNAAHYTTDFRPVPLYEHCMLNGTVYNAQGKIVKTLKPDKQFENDGSCITTLCYSSMTSDESSVLVFCMSKSHVESLAMKIARDVYKANLRAGKTQIKPEIIALIAKLKASPVGLTDQIKVILTGGVGLHHAGLSEEERDIMEEGFRACVLRVLVSTSTLCSGVNLPARHVIVRYGPQLAPLMYRQMAGRAGRTGYDSLGESFLVVNNAQELRSALQLMNQQITAITSCMYRGEGLTSALKQALLEMVSSGAATNKEDLITFLNSTLLLTEKTSTGKTLQVEQLVTTCLQFLLDKEFIRKCESEVGERLLPTRLGRACLAASMRPDPALELHQELERSLSHFMLSSDLHLLYMAVPQEGGAHPDDIDWLHWLDQFLYLPQQHKIVASIVGVEEKFIGAFVASRVNRMAQTTLLNIARHSRFRKALALHDLVREKPLNAVANNMGFSRGQLQAIQQSAAMQAGRVTAFCRELGWSNMEVLMENFKPRLNFGVQIELVELLRISLLDGQHARALFNANYRSLADIAKAQVADIEHILLDMAPYETSHKKENESEFAQRKRVEYREMQEYKLKRRAQSIIVEARQLVQDDIGSEIDWTKASKSHKTEKRTEFKICPTNLGSNKEEKQVANENNEETGRTKNVDESASKECSSKVDDQPVKETPKISEEPIQQESHQPIDSGTSEIVNNEMGSHPLVTEDKSDEVEFSKVIPVINLEEAKIDVCSENEPPATPTASVLIEVPSACSSGYETHKLNGSSPDIFGNSSPEVTPRSITNIILNNNNITTPKHTHCNTHICDNSPDLLESSLLYDSALNDMLCQYDEIRVKTTPQSKCTEGSVPNITKLYEKCPQVNESSPCQVKTLSTSRTLDMNNCAQTDSSSFKLSSQTKKMSSPACSNVSTKSSNQSSASYCKPPVNSHLRNVKSSFPHVSSPSAHTLNSSSVTKNISGLTLAKSPIRVVTSSKSVNNKRSTSVRNVQTSKSGFKSTALPCVSNASHKGSYITNVQDNMTPPKAQLKPQNMNTASTTTKFTPHNTSKPLAIQDISNTVNIKVPQLRSTTTSEYNSKSVNISEMSSCSIELENNSALFDILCQYDASPAQATPNCKVNDSLFDFAFSSSILENNEAVNNNSTVTSDTNHPEVITIDSDSDDSYVNNDFEIVMLDNLSVFNRFSKEWKNKGKHFSLSFACERVEPVVIGANIVGEEAATYQTYDPATEYLNMKLVGAAICWGGLVSYYLDLQNTPGCAVAIRDRLKLLECMLHNKQVTFECYNSKEQLRMLKIWTDISVKGATLVGDPFIASWLLNPERKYETLNFLVLQHCPELSFLVQHAGTMRGNKSLGMNSLASSPGLVRAAVESCITLYVTANLHLKLRELELWTIYKDVELPLICCLVSAEFGGFNMDLVEARRIIDSLQDLKSKIIDEARKYTYPNFNLESWKEITNALYHKLNLSTSLPNGKRTKTFKTDKETLLELAEEHALPKLILDYRSVNYILSKILIPLLRDVENSCDLDNSSEVAVVHPSYLIRSSTGRLYMCEPNLQNIPKDIEIFGVTVKPRNQFKASPGNILISADYRQIELRMLAHFSQDPQLIEILNSGEDIFKQIAAQALNQCESEISDELRQQAKIACYSFIYGKSDRGASKSGDAKGLSLQFISQQLVKCFNTAFQFLEQVKKNCSRHGSSVASLKGRLRWLNKKNCNEPSSLAQAERQAVNTLMQSSAADIIKTAMIRLYCMLEEANIAETTRLVLHIHDELILETTKDNKAQVIRILRKAMECNHNLNVSLPVKLRLGTSWGELKDISLKELEALQKP